MATYVQTIRNMFAAAIRVADLPYKIGGNDGHVNCVVPVGQKAAGETFITNLQTLNVTAVYHVDWPIDDANRPRGSNNVQQLQAALENANLVAPILVYSSDGIKINTNGDPAEVYGALLLLRTARVPVIETQ